MLRQSPQTESSSIYEVLVNSNIFFSEKSKK